MSSPPGPNGSKSVAAQTTRSGVGGSGYTAPEGIVVLVWIQPSEGARAAPMACGPAGPTGWVGEGIPGQPLPGLPAGTSALTSRRQ